MSERSKEGDLKSSGRKRSVGSNPTSPAIGTIIHDQLNSKRLVLNKWEVAPLLSHVVQFKSITEIAAPRYAVNKWSRFEIIAAAEQL